MVEQSTLNVLVVGSSPTGVANTIMTKPVYYIVKELEKIFNHKTNIRLFFRATYVCDFTGAAFPKFNIYDGGIDVNTITIMYNSIGNIYQNKKSFDIHDPNSIDKIIEFCKEISCGPNEGVY